MRVNVPVLKKPWKFIYNPDGSFQTWTVPVVLLVVVLASYGLYAKYLGFYWDDWSYAWVRFFQGLQGLKAMADPTRPMRAYFEAALTPVLGVNPLAWQIYAILLRWIASVALWWFLRQVWRDHSRPIFMVALFYVVYPGFSQQSLAMVYHYYWFFQAIFYVSMGLMVWAVRTPRRFWLGMVSALVLAALQLFSSEYLVGLELLRPIFLWMALASVVSHFKPRLGRTVAYSAPFLLILGAYVYWRIFLIKFPTYQPLLLSQIRTAPLRSLLGLANSIWNSFWVLIADAWENTLQVAIHQFGITRFALIYPILVVLSLLGLLLYQNRLQARPSEPVSDNHPRRYVGQFIGIGLVAILVAGIPYYVTGLGISAHFDEDRFSLSYLLGVCLLLAGLLELLPNLWQSIMLTSVLAALAIGLQFYNSALFRNESDLQKTFAWQLVWRMPGLEPNTLLLTDDTTFPFTDDEGLTYLLNWTYAPGNRTTHFPVAIDTLSARLGVEIPSLEKGQPIYQNYYLGNDFRGSTDQVVVISFNNPSSCLRVLNPAFDQDLIFLPVYKVKDGRITELDAHALPSLAARALPLSNMDQIITNPDQSAKPPAFILGPEPHTTWCYFFEKADLARQTGDWQEVARLGDEAFGSHYYPVDLSEYIVFIEAYARLGRWQDAEKLAHSVSEPAPVINPALCAIWNRTEQAGQLSENDRSQLTGLKQEFQCNFVP
jgi:hypothetical protein